MKSYKFFFTTHRWTGIILSILLLNVAITGFLLLIKKRSSWIQPPTARGVIENNPTISFDQILAAAATVPEAGIQAWADVDRLDVRPDKGIVKVRSTSRWEVQIDTSTGEVVQTMYRRSDLIEQIHDGSFVANWFHLWVSPVAAIGILFLIFSGYWLWLEPKVRRRRRQRRAAQNAN